ncbi:alpha/beta hydrolase [Metabacillus sp. SLBN-84]
MVQIQKDSITGYKDGTVSYSLFKKASQAKTLAIMFPGYGYTAQGPLFHYSTGIFLNRGEDVLHLNYSYQSPFYESFSDKELEDALKRDVRHVIDTVLSAHSYEHFYLIGKSLGTIALAAELGRTAFLDAKIVWLTPLLKRDDVFEGMYTSKKRGLCIIGDSDPCYDQERFEKLSGNAFLERVLINGADHSLEDSEDAVGSVDVLKDVMLKIKRF